MGLDGIEQPGYLWSFQLNHWFPELKGVIFNPLPSPSPHSCPFSPSPSFPPPADPHFFLGRPWNHRFWCLKLDRDRWCHASSIPCNYVLFSTPLILSLLGCWLGFYASLYTLMHQYGMVYHCSRAVMEGEGMEEVDRKNEENGGFCSFWLKFTWV